MPGPGWALNSKSFPHALVSWNRCWCDCDDGADGMNKCSTSRLPARDLHFYITNPQSVPSSYKCPMSHDSTNYSSFVLASLMDTGAVSTGICQCVPSAIFYSHTSIGEVSQNNQSGYLQFCWFWWCWQQPRTTMPECSISGVPWFPLDNSRE